MNLFQMMRNKHLRMQSIIGSILIFIIALSCSNQKNNQSQWIDLFNGKDLSGWKIKFAGHELNDNYKNTFQVADGLLRVCYDNYENFNNKYGHIFYDKKFSNYIIKVEYRFTGEQIPGGPGWGYRNNGIMIHCQSPESMQIEQEFPVSVEAQLLGGNGKDERPTGNVCTPGTHIVMDSKLIKQHGINSNSKTYHGDQWVTMEVEVHGNEKIIHRVNGETVMEYEKPQLDPEDKYAQILIDNGAPIMLNEGYISLQAESHPTEFRSIKLLELSE